MAEPAPTRSPWPATAAAVVAGVGAVFLSLALFEQGAASTLLLLAGPVAFVLAGAVGAWRGSVLAFCVPAVLLLFVPEGKPPAADEGTCDPFCTSDTAGGPEWALALGLLAAALAVVGWAVAAALRAVRRHRALAQAGVRRGTSGAPRPRRDWR